MPQSIPQVCSCFEHANTFHSTQLGDYLEASLTTNFDFSKVVGVTCDLASYNLKGIRGIGGISLLPCGLHTLNNASKETIMQEGAPLQEFERLLRGYLTPARSAKLLGIPSGTQKEMPAPLSIRFKGRFTSLLCHVCYAFRFCRNKIIKWILANWDALRSLLEEETPAPRRKERVLQTPPTEEQLQRKKARDEEAKAVAAVKQRLSAILNGPTGLFHDLALFTKKMETLLKQVS